MKVCFAVDTNYPWKGGYIFDAPDVAPEAWGFRPTPALTTVQEQGEAGKDGYYFLRGEAYRHAEARSILLLVTLRRWDERAADVVEERVAVIFREGNLENIPEALHRLRPRTLSTLLDADNRPVSVRSIRSHSTIDWGVSKTSSTEGGCTHSTSITRTVGFAVTG